MGATEALRAQSPALRPLNIGEWRQLYFALRTCLVRAIIVWLRLGEALDEDPVEDSQTPLLPTNLLT